MAPLIIAADRWLPVPRARLFLRFVVHVPLSLIFTALKQLLSHSAVSLLIAHAPVRSGLLLAALRSSLRGLFQSNFLGYWIVVFIYFAYDYQKNSRQRELETLELERVIADSRLETLRAQLRPNLFFNTLRSISAQVERGPRIARKMLEDLGELLRFSLAHSEEHEVPLKQEIDCLKHYLEIQKARLEDHLRAKVDADSDALHALVPTLVLQPLVEAAIFSGSKSDSRMSCLHVRAWRNNGQLRLSVQEDAPGFLSRSDEVDSYSTGLSNTRERLRRLYGDLNQSFEINSQRGKGLRMDLSIPFHVGEE